MDKSVKKMYKIKKLLPNVYGISSGTVMSYLVVGNKGAMIIDTAYGFEDLSQAVREVTKLPVTVVDSHGHVDHSGGNFYFDTPTCIHEADVELYQKHNSAEMHRHCETVMKPFQRIFFWRNLLSKHPEQNDEKRAGFHDFRFIKEGDIFDLGEIHAQIIEIPGHTQGSVAVYFPEKRLMITSDGANPGPWLFLPESTNLSTYISSLHKLEKYEYDYILTGHSDKLMPKSDLSDWIHVAEHPDMENAKPAKESYFAPGVHPITVWAKGDSKRKGANIMIDPNKVD